MGEKESSLPKGFRWRQVFLRARHLLRSAVFGIAMWRPFAQVAPWVVSAYLLAREFYGDTWPWFTENTVLHLWLFWIAIGSTMIVLFLRGVVGYPSPLASPEIANQVLYDYLTSVGAIVQAKIDRVRSAVPEIRPTTDRFKKISNPGDQIVVITNAVVRFLQGNFDLAENEIDLTVMGCGVEGQWEYRHCFQKQWNRTSADKIMSENSAAATALESGEPLFIPDKITAAREGRYFRSKRDKGRKSKGGSIYVYPVSVDLGSGRTQSIVTIATYGKSLCEPHAIETCRVTEAILREFCRRFELELFHSAIESARKS